MPTPTCRQCGKPTPLGSIHTCSPQQPREWVTYEVQIRKAGSCTWTRDWGVCSKSRAEALRNVKMRREEYSDSRFRAVRIRHTEEVIG